MKHFLLTAGIAFVVACAAVFFASPKQDVPVPKPGAVAGPNLNSPYYIVGDVTVYKGRTANLNQASTTVCAIQSPAATSTLNFGSLRLDVSTSTATVVTLAKSTSPSATTTVLGNAVAIGAGAQITMVASTTLVNAMASDFVFAPNTYFTASLTGGIGTFTPSGVCEVTWILN